MTINVKSLTTVQLEWGTRVLQEADADPKNAMVATMLCAVMLADTKTLLAARKNPEALDPFMEKAGDLPADDAEEAVVGFFERWKAFQMRIGRSVGIPVEAGVMPPPAEKRPPVIVSPALAATLEAQGVELPQ